MQQETAPRLSAIAIARRSRIRVACASCRTRKIKCNGDLRGCQHCYERGQPCVYGPVSDEERRKASKYKRKLKERQQREGLYLDLGPYAPNLQACQGFPSPSAYHLGAGAWWSPPIGCSGSMASTSAPCSPAMQRELEAYFQDAYARQPRYLQLAGSAPTTPVVSRTCFQGSSAALQQACAGFATLHYPEAPSNLTREKFLLQQQQQAQDLGDALFASQQQALLASPISSECASDITSLQDSPQQPNFAFLRQNQQDSSQSWYNTTPLLLPPQQGQRRQEGDPESCRFFSD